MFLGVAGIKLSPQQRIVALQAEILILKDSMTEADVALSIGMTVEFLV